MFLLFFVVWIIFNGRITVEIVLFGLAIAALVFAFICKFMGYSIKKEKRLYSNFFSYMGYFLLLISEIVKANIVVIQKVLTRNEIMEPVIVTFHTSLESESARVLLANSITLTPGTITISLEGDELVVHCLDKSVAEGIEDSVFEKKLKKIERRG